MSWDKDIPADERKFYKVTRFSPDTCGCVMEYAWDTRTAEADRKHLPADIVHACPAHAHHCAKGKDVCAHHEEVVKENQDKNLAVAHLLECLDDEHCHCIKDDDGNEHRVFKREPRFSFNEKRELVLELDKDVPAGHRRELGTRLKERFAGRKIHLK